MTKSIVHRGAVAVLLLFVVSSIVFLTVHIVSGDPVLLMLDTDSNPDPQTVEALRRELGLDWPILTQYANWMFNALQGNLETSYSEHVPVMQSIGSRLPRTLELAGVSLLLTCIIGLPLGVLSALRRGRSSDLMMATGASLGTSTPVYVLGYLLIILFSLNMLGWNIPTLPPSGYVNFSKSPPAHLQRLILPAVTLALGLAASIMRMTHSSMLGALSAEPVRALRTEDLPEHNITIRHVIRNAFIPVVTVIGLQMSNLIGSTVLYETVFNWPGLATLLIKAVNQRDYPLIQGCVLVMSSIFILANMVVDIIYGMLDPRARQGGTIWIS